MNKKTEELILYKAIEANLRELGLDVHYDGSLVTIENKVVHRLLCDDHGLTFELRVGKNGKFIITSKTSSRTTASAMGPELADPDCFTKLVARIQSL